MAKSFSGVLGLNLLRTTHEDEDSLRAHSRVGLSEG